MPQPDQHPDPRQPQAQPPFPAQEQPTPGEAANMDPTADHGEQSHVGLGRMRDPAAIVTGGDSGIGRAVALAFAREGADLVISYLDEHRDAEASARAVEDAGRKALPVPGDVADEGQWRRIVEAAADRLGRLDVLVCNAACQGEAVERFGDLSAERVRHTVTGGQLLA